MAHRLPLLSQPRWSSLFLLEHPSWNIFVTVWKMEFSHPLFLSRLEVLKAVFWALFFFWFSSMISLTLENPLYLFAYVSTLCRTICHPSEWQAAASSLSADLDKITSWSNTLSLCLSERTVWNLPRFLNNPLEEILTLKLLGITICQDLS